MKEKGIRGAPQAELCADTMLEVAISEECLQNQTRSELKKNKSRISTKNTELHSN